MALERHNRIVETTITTGTGAYALGGAQVGFEAVNDRVTDGATVEYTATDDVDFEIGIGTFTAPSTLARTTVLISTNGDAAVDWGAGDKDIFISLPASRMVPGDDTELAYWRGDGVLDGAPGLHWDDGNLRLGINENSPGAQLHIQTSGTGVIGQIIKLTASQTADAFRITDSADVVDFVVTSTGRVGVGIASPAGPLHVYEDTSAAESVGITIEQDGATGDAVLQFLRTGIRRWVIGIDATDNSFRITENSGLDADVRIIINDNGLVGINETNLASQLHVNQSSQTGAIPVVTIEQTDVSEEMIEFVSTIGVGNAIEAIGAKTLTTTHFIKVTLPGGLTRYIPAGTIA